MSAAPVHGIVMQLSGGHGHVEYHIPRYPFLGVVVDLENQPFMVHFHDTPPDEQDASVVGTCLDRNGVVGCYAKEVAAEKDVAG